jgi:hypothetical protein
MLCGNERAHRIHGDKQLRIEVGVLLATLDNPHDQIQHDSLKGREKLPFAELPML